MKTSVYFLLLVSFLFLFSTGKGQCPEWDLTFYSQQDLDNFGFPDCSHFPGNVIIKGYNITDLSNLSQLQSIGGNLEIENNSILTHLDAFPLLESIGGQLRINSNPQLESIATFENLKSIGLIFSLFGNESLAEISGFSELNHVGATLGIGGNPLLSDLEWLSALQTVGSVCGIYNNHALVDLSGLDNLESVGYYLDINNNNNLVSLQGLGSLQTTGGLNIYNNPALSSLGGLGSLQTTGGLNIYNNPALSSLGGLDNLTEINGFFSITNNASLTHLNELSPLTQINGPIFIQNHPLLSDISGLQNIEPAGISGLHILDNPNLETCNLESFCSYLSQGGYVEVSGNSGNCSSYSTFVAECTPCDPPINLGVDNLSTTTVSLIWESEGELFDVEWGTAGFVQGNGTLVTEISGNILDLYLLNPNSSYDFYVRQNCLDVNKESEWAGPFSFSTLSPCPTGSLIFNTQQQIDDFGAIYPHCTEALSITIQGNDITNLNGLSNITYIHQSLTINENPLLENLQGLENLHVVGTGLYIADNDQLVDVNGLTNLQSIGVSLDVRDNPMLENLDGFTNLYSIGSMGFSIMNNSQLTNIDGLSNVYIETSNRINISDNASLQSITGFNNLISTTQITIFFNTSLISINGLNGLQQAGSTIITHNQSLQSIEGFAGLQTTGSLVITNNPDLETMSAFGSLQSIESGYFGITHSKLENLDNFSSLYFSGGEVDFSHNTALENLNGLIGLQSIGGNLNIFINPALENLDGLVNVQSIGGYLLVSQNDVLSDISGLQNIDPATIGGAYGLRIYYNPNLYICNLENLCTYLQGSGIRYIAANAGTCFNEASLGNSCIPCETPQTLGAADVYATQATLLWEGAEALFEIEWGEAGFTHGNGTVISEISENEYILNGLNSATSYEFYVRRDCTLSHYSDWEGPYGFITMPCPTGNFTFTTQQEIDNFETIYGGCTDIVLNSLHIGPDFGNPGDITDLTPLQNIKSVNGNVTIQYNPLLTNLSGLENLTEIGGNLTIYNNLVLTSIDELSSLTEITGDLYIGYNESLTGIYGFNTLENVGNLTISFNNYLDIQGFQNLNQVNGNLILTSLTMANFLSFESLEQIDGELILQYSYINDLSGFNELISMGGLSFSYTTLAEVSGLNSLQSINGRIKIVGTNITNLDFLHNITTINGELNIGANHNLDDISGLQNIHHSSIQYLSFIENSNLYVCNLPNLCTYLSNPANPRNIYGNAGNCLDEATVTADCTPCAAPVDLGVENIQTNAAKLIWEADGDLFEIEWGEAGFTQGAGTTITDIVENQYELSGLQGGTSYEFYVRTDCGGFNQSDWTGPFGFTTLLCPTGDFIFTSQQEIDDFGALYGHCTIVTGSIIINGADITNLAGLSALESIGGILYIYNNPQLESLSGLSNLTTVGNDVSVFYNTQLENLDGLNSLTAIGGALDINSNNNLADISALQNIDPVTITHLYIRENLNLSVCNLPNFCTYLAGSGARTISDNAGDCISEAAVTAACVPACDAPTALTATATSVSATLGWTSDGNNFDIEWGTQGFTQGSGTLVTDIATNSYNLTNLDYSTQYEFYVRQDCTVNESDWAGPFSFTTLPQCPTGYLSFYSQADIDAFAINYPNCTQISGSLYISSSDIVNLNGLSNLISVGGDLYIDFNPLTNLDGLSNLTSVGGCLDIYFTPNLTDLDGLSNLTSVGGYLSIAHNSSLTSLNGLSNLTSVGGFLYIEYNQNLTNLDGLSNLTSIGADLVIKNNSSLNSITGLQNIDSATISSTFYGYGLYIVNNPLLSVCNLPNFCTYLQGSGPRTISDNAGDCVSEAAVTAACTPACDAPTNLTATNITSVSATLGWTSAGNNFDIEWGTQGFTQGSGTTVTGITANSYNLTNLDYNTQYEFYVRQDCSVNESDWAGPFSFTTLLQCPEVVLLLSQAEVDAFATNYPNCTQFWTLTISGSDITDLSPLSNITILYDGLYINDNPVLTNLNGLDNLTSVVGLNIISNPSLIDISGLQNINPATIIPSYGMYITNNPQLSICNLPNFCEYLAGSGDRYIAGNGGDCNSPQAVLDACVTGNCPSYTRWNGMNWSNGEPDINKKVIIDGYFSANLEACKLEITPYGILNLPAEFTVTVNKSIINNGFVLVQSNANLIQIEDVSNIGAITVQRNSSPMMRLDYTLWSSPVDGQGIHAFSPQTVANRIYTYEGEEGYQVVGNLAANFEAGKGYMFRAPNDWNQTTDANGGNPVAYPGEFIGVPFNGDISVDIHPMSYTSVGNPYPSNIRLGDDLMHTGNDTFLNANPEVSTIYFWTNTYEADGNGGYVGNNWATYTFMGGTSAGLGAGSQTPTAYVAPSQGFIIRSIGNGTQINFNNSMRVSNPALFFKGEEEERHRFWLNLKGINSENHNQILIGYTDGASYGIDHQIDGKMFGYEGPAIYNRIEEEAFVIQGRPLPFESSDVVPLGFKTETANKYVISLSQYEGLFAQGSVTIYLKDKLLGLTHNLMESDYEFESGAGEFEERFEVVYQEESTMGTSEFYTNSILIYTDQEYIVMDSQKEEILTVELYDLSGKNLFRNDKVNSKYYRLKSDHLGTQVLIVKVQTANGEETSKKLINQ